MQKQQPTPDSRHKLVMVLRRRVGKLVMLLRELVFTARRSSKGVRAERSRINKTARELFPGESLPEEQLIAADSLHSAFPSLPPARLKEAAKVLVDAMAPPGEDISVERLKSAATRIAGLVAAR